MSSTPQTPSLKTLGPRLIVDGLAPQGVFLALNSTLGLRWAIAGASLISIAIAIFRKMRRQSIGWVLPISVGFIVLRGTAGIVSKSDAVYFGPGIANNFIVGAVFVASVPVGKPIIGLIAPYVYPLTEENKLHPLFRKITGRLTLLWGIYTLLMGVFQWWLLVSTTTNQFVVVRALVGWPTTIALTVFSFWYPRVQIRRLRAAEAVEAVEPDRVPPAEQLGDG